MSLPSVAEETLDLDFPELLKIFKTLATFRNGLNFTEMCMNLLGAME